MNIWIDILTPKQILFFEGLVNELRNKGHNVLMTSRDYREVNLLSSKKKYDLISIGKHGGGSLNEKLKASLERSLKLTELIRDLKIDYAISFCSPECARVSFGRGLKHLCISDSPHSKKVSKLTVPLSYKLLTPWIIPNSSWVNYGIKEENIIKYKGLDPISWLSRRKSKKSNKNIFGLNPSKKTITVRLEESQASYLLSYDQKYSKKLIDSLLTHFDDCELFILGRYEDQINNFKSLYRTRIKIPNNIVDGTALLSISDVFIGMGGTMTAESSLLGIPTISAYQGEMLFTEKFLIKKNILTKPKTIDEIVKVVHSFLYDDDKRFNISQKAEKIRSSMDDPIMTIIDTIEKEI